MAFINFFSNLRELIINKVSFRLEFIELDLDLPYILLDLLLQGVIEIVL